MKGKWFFLLAFLFIGVFIFYQNRSVPEPGRIAEVTILPSEFKNVLGIQASKPETSVRVPILLYHYVEYVKDKGDTIRKSLNITPDTLTSQIETLKNAGYIFINTSDLANVLSGKAELPRKPVILTFDDGYMDFYTDVFPILKEENVKAVEYVIPDFLNRPNFMFTFQLREIAKSSLVEIGAHTMDHVWLKGVSRKTAQFEIAQSRKVLQDLLGLPINSFAYPYGAFDQQAIDIVKDAGLTNAVSTVTGINQNLDTQYF